MKEHWQILRPNIDTVRDISTTLKCGPVIAAILVNRKITSPDRASAYLHPSLNDIRPPFSIKDMEAAVTRIYAAIMRKEKILIFGDYDVDGITATALLFEFLRYAGADVIYYLPHRVEEGYGLQDNHILGMALPRGINLIITADCGSGSHVAAKAAKKADIDIVITDHHNIAENFPGAVAVVNPKRPDCNAGFHTLAGVGVVFFLVVCLRAYLREKKFWNGRVEPNLKNFCDLVALGTVADMVPLVDENRIFTRSGLQIINSGYRRGIKALVETCNINKQFVDTDDIAYRLAPRLNAAGRIAHANAAVELLIAQDIDSARQMSADLNTMNARRQRIENTIMEEILAYLKHETPLPQKKTLVLSHPDWHEGVLGIVASRIAAKFYRPAVLISTKDGIGKGSVRSIPGIDIHEVLTACEDSLESFGGHSMAAGLQIRPENINRFKEQFENETRKAAAPEAFIRGVCIDYELDFRNISDELIDALESLQPFGAGNPEPLFMTQNVKILFAKIVGKNHRRLLLKQDSDPAGRAINAFQFNIDPGVAPGDKFDQIAYKLRWNRWQERKSPQIIIEET